MKDRVLSILLRKKEEAQNFDTIGELDFVLAAIKDYKKLKTLVKAGKEKGK